MDGGVAAILAAALGAVGAAIGLIITKENKTSEFRQIWINELRTAIAILSQQYQVARKGSPFTKDERLKAKLEVNRLVAEIQLRLNNKKPNIYEKELKRILSDVATQSQTESDAIFGHLGNLLEAGSGILKTEWKRVKRGEWKYRFCVWIASLLALSSITIAVLYIYLHWEKLLNLLLK